MKPITIGLFVAACMVAVALMARLFAIGLTTHPQAAVISAYIHRLDPGMKAITRCLELERTLGRALTEDEIRRVFAEVHGKPKE